MAKNDEHRKTDGDLAAAASLLDAEIASFEALAATLRKMPLGTKKQLERAARSLTDAAAYEERLSTRLRGLVEAIQIASQRQQESAASIVARAKEIEARNAEYDELYARYAELGTEARALTELATELVTPMREATSPAEVATVGGRIDELILRMKAFGERADEIARAAAVKEMTEIAREADALKQQLASARNKLSLVRQSQIRGTDRSN